MRRLYSRFLVFLLVAVPCAVVATGLVCLLLWIGDEQIGVDPMRILWQLSFGILLPVLWLLSGLAGHKVASGLPEIIDEIVTDGRMTDPPQFYHPRTALGAEVTRIRDEKIVQVHQERLARQSTLVR